MNKVLHTVQRRSFLRATLMAGGALSALTLTAAFANADPVELRYFYRAPWPSSEIYANWMIDGSNKKNGDRIHVLRGNPPRK